MFHLGDHRPYFKAMQKPRNKKKGRKIYINQIIRFVIKDEQKANKKVNKKRRKAN
jgi:phosphoglycerol transferase MdoB-like AlkP superfamily enzyme